MSEPASKQPTSALIEYPGEDPAVTRFREFLNINTVSRTSEDTSGPQPDYGRSCTCTAHSIALSCRLSTVTFRICFFPDGVVRFLEREAKAIGLPFRCIEVSAYAAHTHTHTLPPPHTHTYHLTLLTCTPSTSPHSLHIHTPHTHTHTPSPTPLLLDGPQLSSSDHFVGGQ